MNHIAIGLAGLGTVGTGVYRHLNQNCALLSERLGLTLTVRRVGIKSPAIRRSVNLPAQIVTNRWEEVIDDPAVDIVVELMGGIETPRRFVMRALDAGKVVVTANKALLAEHGVEIFERSAEKQVPIFFEAAVAGGIVSGKVSSGTTSRRSGPYSMVRAITSSPG